MAEILFLEIQNRKKSPSYSVLDKKKWRYYDYCALSSLTCKIFNAAHYVQPLVPTSKAKAHSYLQKTAA